MMHDQLHDNSRRMVGWIMQDKHKQKAQKIGEDALKAFTEHPKMTGETYLQHLWFTVKMALHFIFVSLVMVTHGLFPFLFVKTASSQIESIYRIMKSRIPQSRLVVIDAYEI